MKIGNLALQARVSVDTIRYYERRGLLPQPMRRPSGYRSYPPATIERIHFIRDLQGLGLRLDDIIEVLQMVDDGSADCGNQQPRFEAVIGRIDGEIARLQATRDKVFRLLEQCRSDSCSWVGCG